MREKEEEEKPLGMALVYALQTRGDGEEREQARYCPRSVPPPHHSTAGTSLSVQWPRRPGGWAARPRW